MFNIYLKVLDNLFKRLYIKIKFNGGNSMSMPKVFHSQLKSVLSVVYNNQLALFIHGTFGIGKSIAVEEFCKLKAAELGLEFSKDFNDINDEGKFIYLPIILHQYDPAELKGLPFPNEDRTKTVFLPMGLLPEKGHGLIFFDEINLASPMIQNNAYQIIQDRRLGFWKCPDGYTAIGAGNLVDDRGHTYEMAMPLNNRFMHIQLNVPAVHDIEVEGQNVKGWVNDFALSAGVDSRIINYLSYQPGHLYKYNPESDTQDVTCATPRMWEKVSKMIKGVTDENMLHLLVASGVGSGIASEFVAWLKLSKKYDIAGIYKGKAFKTPTEIDQLYSLISAFVGYYEEKPDNTKSVRLLELSRLFQKEHTVMILNQAKSVDPTFFKRVKTTDPKKFSELADDIFDLLV